MNSTRSPETDERYPSTIDYIGLLFGIGGLAIGAAEISKHWQRFFP